MQTIIDLLKWNVAVRGDRCAIQYNEEMLSWHTLEVYSTKVACYMHHIGVKEGEHIGIWSRNSKNWVIVFLALLKLKAIPILLNTHLKEMEIGKLLTYTDTSFVLFEGGCKDVVFSKELEKMNRPSDRYISMDTLLKEAHAFHTKSLEHVICKQVQPEDMACMIFTSGTTACPKAVMLTHRNVVSNAKAMMEALHLDDTDRMCIAVPMFHCFGMTAGIISCMSSGACMYILEGFRTKSVWHAITEGGCTILSGVPSMFLALLENETYADRSVFSLKSGIIAGSTIQEKDYKRIVNRLGDIRLLPSYGQTETSPCISIADWDTDRQHIATHCGKLIKGVQARIVDLKSCNILDHTLVGEIEVCGENVMRGYYKREEENTRVFTKDGWLKTGDMGFFDREGNLHLSERIKEIIIRAGENISPREIEEVVYQMDGIDMAKVIGIPAKVIQEEIVLCIKKEVKVSDMDILAFIRKRLASYKVPTRVIRLETFTMTPSGKIDLVKLKKTVLAQVKENS